MSDIALSLVDNKYFDLAVGIKDFDSEEGLFTAVAMSLFTDVRVSEEELAAGDRDRRGWWGDVLAEIPGDKTGSKLWLLKREKQTEETRKRAQEYAEEALRWLIEENIAQSVTVEAEFVSPGFLGLQISIQQPKTKVAFRFKVNWKQELARGT